MVNKNQVCDTGMETLQRENAKLLDIFEFLPDAAFVIDEKKRVTHWNKACEIMTGVAKESLIGTDDYSIPFYNRRRPILVDLLDEEPAGLADEYHFIRRNGAVINYITISIPLLRKAWECVFLELELHNFGDEKRFMGGMRYKEFAANVCRTRPKCPPTNSPECKRSEDLQALPLVQAGILGCG